MAVLEAVISGKLYQLGCEDEEKDYIKTLIGEINTRINKSKKQNPELFTGISEDKLFLYQLLLVYSELKELKNKKLEKETILQQKNEIYADKEIDNLKQVIKNINTTVTKLDNLIPSK